MSFIYRYQNFNILKRSNSLRVFCQTRWDSSSSSETEGGGSKLGGIARAFLKFDAMIEKPVEKPKIKQIKPFLTLLRNSKLMQIGDPKGKIVEGRVFHVVGNDLYIDFGGKFHVVCQRPTIDPEMYVRGAIVRIMLLELELSRRFLGSSTDMTLLEGDAKLRGIISSPVRRTREYA